MASVSSTPPAPAPTTAIVVAPAWRRTRSSSASQRSLKRRIGFTGTACSSAPGDLVEPRRRTDVDRQRVVGHRRPVAAEHLARRAVDADHLVAVVARTGEFGQAAQVDVHVVEAVVSGDVAGQHARVRRVGIGADHRQAHAGQRLHGEHVQHADVAVAAADQDDVSEHRGGRGAAFMALATLRGQAAVRPVAHRREPARSAKAPGALLRHALRREPYHGGDARSAGYAFRLLCIASIDAGRYGRRTVDGNAPDGEHGIRRQQSLDIALPRAGVLVQKK